MTPRLCGKTILVVEDNPLNMKLLRALLALHDCTVLEAPDAEIAIETARLKKPDLILMDLHLPSMDGLAATTTLGNLPETSYIPIIAVTSCAMEGDSRRALAAGCRGYISKPINTRTFVDTITKFLAGEEP